MLLRLCVIPHFMLSYTSCYLALHVMLHVISHFMLSCTSCYLTLPVISHFMLSRTSCYLTLLVISHFMLSYTPCYLTLHVILHFMLSCTSCYFTLHVSTTLRSHLQGTHLCKTAARYWLDRYMVQGIKIICNNSLTNVYWRRDAMLGTIAALACNDWEEQQKKSVVERHGQRTE